jgi:hypothetical protein
MTCILPRSALGLGDGMSAPLHYTHICIESPLCHLNLARKMACLVDRANGPVGPRVRYISGPEPGDIGPLRGPATSTTIPIQRFGRLYDLLPKREIETCEESHRLHPDWSPAKTLHLFEQYQAANNAKWPRGRAFHRERIRQTNAQTGCSGIACVTPDMLAQDT